MEKRNGSGGHHERHGGSTMNEYHVWSSMKARCYKKNTWNYSRYGGRGIFVCEEWKYFSKFIEDIGPRPSKKHQLDRIDVNGPYCKENCRWTTPNINAANRPRWTNKMGSYRKGQKFVSKIGINNKVIHIGTFDTEKDARDAYVKMFYEWYGFYPIKMGV